MSAAAIGSIVPAPRAVRPVHNSSSASLVDYALAYAAHGWPVVPIQPIRKGACGCGRPHGKDEGQCASPGKHPIGALVPDGHNDATIEPAIIRRWWVDVPDAHVGVRLDAAGLIAVDIDPRNGGDQQDLPFDVAQTLTAHTGGGGLHALYRVPAGRELLTKASWPGIDLKHHGYIVVEPSGHALGGRYGWRDWDPLTGEVPEIAFAPSEIIRPPEQLVIAATKGTEHLSETQIADLRATLATFPSDDRPVWIAVGHACASIANEGVGFELWDEWSRRSTKYDPNDQSRRWNGFRETRSNWRAVFSIARQNGGRNIATGTVDPEFKQQVDEMLAKFTDPGGTTAASSMGLPTIDDLQRYEVSPIDPVDAQTAPHVIEKIVPVGEVTLLGGHGGAGKSFLALLLAVLVAIGRNLGGLTVERRKVLFFSAEDDRDELLRRLHRLCKALGVDRRELVGWLTLLDVTDLEPTLMDAPRGGAMGATLLFERLTQYVEARDFGLVIVDNASDTFGGEENERRHVRAFLRALRRGLARRKRAVILLAHVNKATAQGVSRGNESYSGSTAWHNSVRSRLVLEGKPGEPRILRHEKANKGELADEMAFDWTGGALVLASDAEHPAAEFLRETRAKANSERDGSDEEWILAAVERLDGEGTPVNAATNGAFSAASTLAKLDGLPAGLQDRGRLNRLIDRLRKRGALQVETRRKDYKARLVLVAVRAPGTPEVESEACSDDAVRPPVPIGRASPGGWIEATAEADE